MKTIEIIQDVKAVQGLMVLQFNKGEKITIKHPLPRPLQNLVEQLVENGYAVEREEE